MSHFLKPVVKPGVVRKVSLYLIDPERFVIEFTTPKRLGQPRPLYYDIVINNHVFKKMIIQNESQSNDHHRKPFIHRILVKNCDHGIHFKVGIDTYNDKISGIKTSIYRITTICAPSIIRNLSINNGIITFKASTYKSFANLIYELIDHNDINQKTVYSTNKCIINISKLYKNNLSILQNKQWRIRIKESKCNYFSYSPVINYNIGDIVTKTFRKVKLFDVNKLKNIKTKTINYPKWIPPSKPEILKDINNIKLIDFGSYLLVPSSLNPANNNNVLTCITFSDTHTKHKMWRFDKLPSADILIHCGDFTFDGRESEVKKFEKWGKFISSLHINEQKNIRIYSDYYGKHFKQINKDPLLLKMDKLIDYIDCVLGKNDDKIVESMYMHSYRDDYSNVMDRDIDLNDRKYKHLICIAGNHETTFDVKWYNKIGSNAKRYHKCMKPEQNAEIIKNIIVESSYWTYLEDSMINLYGLNIFGSPYQPYYYNWAFQLGRGNELMKKWKLIPSITDILITHGPPFCHGDKLSLKNVQTNNDNLEYTGDKELMKKIKEIKNIKYHIFGHVHSGYGCSIQKQLKTIFINASSCNGSYQPVNKPILFYISKP